MATKAELEAELDRLRAEMAERPEEGSRKDEPEISEPGSDEEQSSAMDRFLSEHDLQVEDFEKLLEQLSEELGNLPQHKPVLTALGAFALGFAAGRMSK